MEIKNILTMKQPDLGKMIYDLRKQKGLTQEELVAQCNINVRTIQRIEAGEVTPRSYTIKAILDVLGTSLETFEQQEKTLENLNFSPIFGITKNNLSSIFKIAWILGIAFILLNSAEIIGEYYRLALKTSFFNNAILIVLKALSTVCLFFFMRGFIAIGKIYNSSLLSITSIIIIISTAIFLLIDISFLFSQTEYWTAVLILKSVFIGVLTLLLGIGNVLLFKKVGNLILVTGIFEILTGLAFLFVVPEVGMALLFPMELLEIIVLYTVWKNLKN